MYTGVGTVSLIICMLAAFHQVVQGAVDEAQLRHKANDLVVEATWRCNATPPPVPLLCARLLVTEQMPVRYAVAHQPR